MLTRPVLTTAAAVGGAALFVWAVRSAGVAEILDGIQRVGWGLVILLALGGIRFALRAAAWRLCMPPGTRVTLHQAFDAYVAGDAIGSVTPLGLLASEPTKLFLTRHHLATREAAASLALENLVYAASVVAMIAVGAAVMLATVPMPAAWRWAAAGGLVLVAVAVVIALRMMRGTWDPTRGARPHWRERLAGVRTTALEFSAADPSRLWRAFIFDLGFHALAVVDVYLTLTWLLGDASPTVSQALVFEAFNRIVIVAFKFVPFRIGVDEARTGALAPLLAVSASTGVTLAVVRKVRNLVWSGVGLAIIAAHPAREGSRSG